MKAEEQVSMLGHYDPTMGGDGFQSYFADMLLDTDRNLQYFHAISMAIKQFSQVEGRKPVVLDAGCGTGFLTACAVYAGAEHVYAIDFSMSHVDAVRSRMASFEDVVTPLLVDDYHANPHAFDMLICELLGTCSNSESAFLYMRQYAWGMSNTDVLELGVEPHSSVTLNMNRHKSGNQYIIPQRVVQYVRRCDMPTSTPLRIHAALERGIVPTNHIRFPYWMLRPGTAQAFVIRQDNYANNFECVQPQVRLDAGTYAMEWIAELWDGVHLHNTWEWAYSNRSSHYASARASAWGLMLFSVPASTKSRAWANRTEEGIDRADDQIPSIIVNKRYLDILVSDDIEDGMLSSSAETEVTTMSRIAMRHPPFQTNIRMSNGEKKYILRGYISTNLLSKNFPVEFHTLLFNTTVTPVFDQLCNLSSTWHFTTEHCLCLPVLYAESREDPRDLPVSFIPARDSSHYDKWMHVGALFRLQCVEA